MEGNAFGRSRGFTLIEVLVVIFIISIVTSVALLSINRNDNKRLESFASELTQILTLAEEQAMLQPTVLGLSYNDESFAFLRLKPALEQSKDNWLPLQDRMLGNHFIPSDIEMTVQVADTHTSTDDEKDKAIPKIIISTNGDITPFKIFIGKRGQKPRYVIIGHADGTVTNKLLS